MKTNLKNLMTRAWDIRRVDGVNMSEALTKAWAEVKAAKYEMDMDFYAEAVKAAVADVKANISNIHDEHKVIILTAALRADRVNGMAMLFGQQAGLVKWAYKNYAC